MKLLPNLDRLSVAEKDDLIRSLFARALRDPVSARGQLH